MTRVTIRNNSTEDIAFRLFLVNMQMTLKPDDGVILSIETSEEVEYYLNLNIDGLGVEAEAEPDLPSLTFPNPISNLRQITGQQFMDDLIAEVEKTFEMDEPRILIKQGSTILDCGIDTEGQARLVFYPYTEYDNPLFYLELDRENNIVTMKDIVPEIYNELNFDYYHFEFPVNPVPSTGVLSTDATVIAEFANNMSYIENSGVSELYKLTQVGISGVEYKGIAIISEGSLEFRGLDDVDDQCGIAIVQDGETGEDVLSLVWHNKLDGFEIEEVK